MKKLLALLMAAVMMMCLAGCGSLLSEEPDYSYNTTTTTTTRTTTTTAPKAKTWELRYYVDEFDQPTTDWYVSTTELIVGKFSNSATTDSRLEAKILVDATDIAFVLYEYGSNRVKNSYSSVNWYTIKMRDTTGKDHTMEGGILSGGDRIYVLSEYENTILNALKKPGTVHFVIYDSDRTVVQYKFSVETDNFAELIK